MCVRCSKWINPLMFKTVVVYLRNTIGYITKFSNMFRKNMVLQDLGISRAREMSDTGNL